MRVRRTFRATAAAAAVVACAGCAGVATPLHAEAVGISASGVVCPEVVEFQFQYPLTTGFASGLMTQSYSGGCVSSGAGASTDGPLFPLPVSQGTFVYLPPGPFAEQVPYSGSCILATSGMIFWGDSSQTGLLVGGSVFVGEPPLDRAENGAVYTEVDVVAPLSPCNEFSAVGAGSDLGVFEF
jgi:hypothetical protein